jgi:hypothetical protein
MKLKKKALSPPQVPMAMTPPKNDKVAKMVNKLNNLAKNDFIKFTHLQIG